MLNWTCYPPAWNPPASQARGPLENNDLREVRPSVCNQGATYSSVLPRLMFSRITQIQTIQTEQSVPSRCAFLWCSTLHGLICSSQSNMYVFLLVHAAVFAHQQTAVYRFYFHALLSDIICIMSVFPVMGYIEKIVCMKSSDFRD